MPQRLHTRTKNPEPLGSILGNSGGKKLLYNATGMECTFCRQKGHLYHFCAGRESVPTPSQRCAWTDSALSADKTDLSLYDDMSLETALSTFLELGNKLNQGNPYSDSTKPVHRLRSRLGWWLALGAGLQPLSWICYGVPLRFYTEPPHYEHPNWSGIDDVLVDNPDWLHGELDKQVQLERLFIVDENFPAIVHPIGVTKRERLDGSVKYRKLDDARLANAFEASMAHKFETIYSIPSLVQPGDKVWWLDLTDFYYQIPLHPDAWRYTCFCYDSIYYCSHVLLMGQKPATFWCTKITRPVLRFFRYLTIRCSSYIDDWFGAGNAARVETERRFVFTVLEKLGFIINKDKSATACHDQGVHLGFTVDATHQKLSIPDKKIDSTVLMIQQLVASHDEVGYTTHETLRKVVGTCSSLHPACRQINVFLRSSHKFMNTHAAKQTHVSLSKSCLSDLLDGAEYLARCDGFLFSDTAPEFDYKLDAGETGYGGTFVNLHNNTEVRYQLPLPEHVVGSSSTKRELFGADVIFSSSAQAARNTTVHLHMDSAPSIQILLRGGSKIPDLNTHAKNIIETAQRFNIRLLPIWVNRENNTVADELSKVWASFHTEKISPYLVLHASMIHGNIPLTCKKVGELPHFFNVRARYKKRRTRLLLLHPVWEAQIWWPHLVNQRSHFFEAGDFSTVFPELSSRIRHVEPKPTWRFQVSLL